MPVIKNNMASQTVLQREPWLVKPQTCNLDMGAACAPSKAPRTVSPSDSLAPALRANAAAAVSSGSELGSHPSYDKPHLTNEGQTCRVTFAETARAREDVLSDLPDLFGDLEVPSLEQLLHDTVAAEAELFPRLASAVAASAMPPPVAPLRRATTMPPHTLLPTKTAAFSLQTALSLDQPVGDRRLPPHQPLKRRQSAPDNGMELERASSARKSLDRPSPSCREVRGMQSLGGYQPGTSPLISPRSQAGLLRPSMAPHGTPQGTAPSSVSVVDYVLDSAFGNPDVQAALPAPPCSSQSVWQRAAAAVPWLSPAAAISAANASRPQDEKVLQWLLFGKNK